MVSLQGNDLVKQSIKKKRIISVGERDLFALTIFP